MGRPVPHGYGCIKGEGGSQNYDPDRGWLVSHNLQVLVCGQARVTSRCVLGVAGWMSGYPRPLRQEDDYFALSRSLSPKHCILQACIHRTYLHCIMKTPVCLFRGGWAGPGPDIFVKKPKNAKKNPLKIEVVQIAFKIMQYTHPKRRSGWSLSKVSVFQFQIYCVGTYSLLSCMALVRTVPDMLSLVKIFSCI